MVLLVFGSGFEVLGLRVQNWGFGVCGFGSRVWGVGVMIWGAEVRRSLVPLGLEMRARLLPGVRVQEIDG